MKNALADLANWSRDLSQQGKFKEAVNVLDIGIELAPKDATLTHNRKAIWGDWAETTAKSGQDDEAIAILREAQAKSQDNQFLAMQAWIYLRRGEALVDAR